MNGDWQVISRSSKDSDQKNIRFATICNYELINIIEADYRHAGAMMYKKCWKLKKVYGTKVDNTRLSL